ncbi:MAG: class I SAM-dependent methyltransferase, partial [Acidimicrobiales bacterium]
MAFIRHRGPGRCADDPGRLVGSPDIAGQDHWDEYLEAFHGQRPGVTEEILGRSRAGGISPYRWLLEALPSSGSILDLACGSAPLARQHTEGGAGQAVGWVGIDRSRAELARARASGTRTLLRGDAAALALAPNSFDAVACSMALMLTCPIEAVLGEICRVLRPGGTTALLLPAAGPLEPGDWVAYGRLLLALRCSRLTYPNDGPLRNLAQLVAGTGLEPASDQRLRFAYPLVDGPGGAGLVDGLYLPGVPQARR